MFRSLISLSAICFIAAPNSAAPVPAGPAGTPTLMARLQPVNKLLDDAKFLAAKFANEKFAAKLEGEIASKLGVTSLDDTGIDRSKPCGLYVFLDADLPQSTAVVMLPVANSKSLLEFVGKFEAKAEKVEDELYSLAIPGVPLPVFVRFAQGYAYVAAMNKASVDVAKLLPPAKVFAEDEAAILAVTAFPEAAPEAVTKMALEQIQVWAKDLTEELESAIDQSEAKLFEKWASLSVTEAKKATVKVGFDRASGELTFDLKMTPKPGTRLAGEIAGVKSGSSLFNALVGQAGAINFAFNTEAGTELRKSMAESIREGAEEFLSNLGIEVADEKLKAEVKAVTQAMIPTIESGLMDAALSLRAGAKKYTGLAGVRVVDGKKLEAAVRKLVAALPDDAKKVVALDAGKESGFSIHTYDPKDTGDMAEKLLGNTVVHFGFSDQAMVIAVGEDAAKLVGSILAEAKAGPAPSLQIDVTPGKLKNLCDAIDESIYGYVLKVFGTEERLRIYSANVKGGDTLHGTASISVQMILGASLMTGGIGEDPR